MRVVILGSGIIGVTTAYILAKRGCEVTVLEKNPESAMGCSYANGGQLSFSHVEPWSSSFFNTVLNGIKPNSYISVKDFKNPEFLKWSWSFFKNSSKKNVQDITKKLIHLGAYSRSVLQEILKDESISFVYKKQGILHFYRNNKSFLRAIKQAEFQTKFGCNIQILNAQECLKKEPTLIKLLDQEQLAGGLLFPDDASGDAALFTKSLEKICKDKYNVNFVYNCNIKNILTNYERITGINSSQGVFQGDSYISALGAYDRILLKSIGIKHDIYPIKGYSLSIPVNKKYSAPKLSLTDSENKVVYSNFGLTFRAAGTAEFCNLKLNHNPIHINFLKNVIKSTYSDFGDIAKAQEWFGFRPYSPDCLPYVGLIKRYKNLYINSGHGSLGWTNSFASAKVISDQIFQRTIMPELAFLQSKVDKI